MEMHQEHTQKQFSVNSKQSHKVANHTIFNNLDQVRRDYPASVVVGVDELQFPFLDLQAVLTVYPEAVADLHP